MKNPIIDKNNIKVYLSEWEDRQGEHNLPHSLIFPKNTYSPWLDQDFLKFYSEKIEPNTLVDIYRCYELYTISEQLRSKRGNVIEVGVWRGGTALILRKSLKQNDYLYLCDTFEGVVKASNKDNFYKNGEHSDTSYDYVSNLFDSYDNIKILKGIFPEDTASFIQDTQFKLCHIDVDVYQSALDVFEWVVPKLIVGGIIVFDDYGFAACEGITNLVNILREREDFITLYNLNGHAIMIKVR